MKQHMHFHLSSHNHDGVFSDKQNWHNGEIIIRGNRTPNSNQSIYTKKTNMKYRITRNETTKSRINRTTKIGYENRKLKCGCKTVVCILQFKGTISYHQKYYFLHIRFSRYRLSNLTYTVIQKGQIQRMKQRCRALTKIIFTV